MQQFHKSKITVKHLNIKRIYQEKIRGEDVNEIGQKKKKSMLSTLIRYVFGVFLLLLSAASFSSSFTAGFLFLIATLITIPPTATQLERKSNYSMSGTVRFFVVFLLVFAGSSVLPPVDSTTTINNSTDSIAAPLLSVNDSSTIVLPASKETHEVIEPETYEAIEPETHEAIEPETYEQSKTQITTSNTIETDRTLLYASSESDVYHHAGCSYIKRIKPENLITFKSVEDAEAAGYRACKRCG